MYLHRTLCEVLHEMRDCTKTNNFSYLPGLIEEAQNMANRMESKLAQVRDIEDIDKRWHAAREKNKELRAKDKENHTDGRKSVREMLDGE